MTDENSKAKVLIIVGPTAVGKSALAVELAKLFNGEIISADSQQVYRGLDIGTAKVTADEMQGVAHHLIDVRDLEENFSAHDFVKAAEQLIEEISGRKKLPIIVGGTGLYIQSLTEGYHLGGEENHEKMQQLRAELSKLSDEALKAKVRLSEFNRRRAIRAIELETFGSGENKTPAYHFEMIGLTLEREKLYARINQRVNKMLAEGLLDEAAMLYENYPEAQAAKAIGYKEFFPYFEGKCRLEDASEQLKQDSRRYAKRQMTWFRNRMSVDFYDISSQDFPKNVIISVEEFLRS